MQVLPFILHCSEWKGGRNVREEVIQKVKEKKIIAIVRKVYGEDCRKLTEALLAGGISLMEFTFDQNEPDDWEKTCENIKMVRKNFEGRMYCGAGTVLTKRQVELAAEAGAQFIVSPSVNCEVIEETKKRGMVSMPGAMTVTEIVNAAEYGADFVKVFPAADLGVAYIKAIRSPINHIPLLAVGGVNERNIGEFIEAGTSGVGIGGDLVNRKWIVAGDFEKIRKTAEALVKNIGGYEK